MLLLLVDARYADYWKQLEKMCETAKRYCSSKFEKSMTDASRRDLHVILGAYGTGEALSSHLQDMLARVTGKSAPAPVALILKHWADRPYQVARVERWSPIMGDCGQASKTLRRCRPVYLW